MCALFSLILLNYREVQILIKSEICCDMTNKKKPCGKLKAGALEKQTKCCILYKFKEKRDTELTFGV